MSESISSVFFLQPLSLFSSVAYGRNREKENPSERGVFDSLWRELLHLFDESLEGFRILYSHLGEHLAVEGDVLLGREGDEIAIDHAMEAERIIEPDNPEAPEVALLGAAVAVGVLASLDDGLFGLAEQVLTAPTVTLGGFEDILVALFGHDASLDSTHIRVMNPGMKFGKIYGLLRWPWPS